MSENFFAIDRQQAGPLNANCYLWTSGDQWREANIPGQQTKHTFSSSASSSTRGGTGRETRWWSANPSIGCTANNRGATTDERCAFVDWIVRIPPHPPKSPSTYQATSSFLWYTFSLQPDALKKPKHSRGSSLPQFNSHARPKKKKSTTMRLENTILAIK